MFVCFLWIWGTFKRDIIFILLGSSVVFYFDTASLLGMKVIQSLFILYVLFKTDRRQVFIYPFIYYLSIFLR